MILALLLASLAPSAGPPAQIGIISESAAPQKALPGHFLDASDDGRYALLSSFHQNVVLGQVDPELTVDLFLVDRIGGTTRLVTHTGDDVTTTGSAFDGVISGDGSTVVFSATGSGLVSGYDDRGFRQAYKYEVSTGVITPLTRDASTPALGGDGDTKRVAVDRFGAIAAITSRATNLLAGFVDGNSDDDAFSVNLQTGAKSVISHAVGSPLVGSGASAIGFFFISDLAIDDLGRTVIFSTRAVNLVAGFTPPPQSFLKSVYRHDLATSTNALVSSVAGSPSVAAPDGALVHGMSADGTKVLFSSASQNLVPGQIQPVPGRQVYLYDATTGAKRLVSHAMGDMSRAANGRSDAAPTISANGGWIALGHTGNDMLSGVSDTNAAEDLFLYSVAADSVVRLVTHLPGQPTMAASTGENIYLAGLSSDGTRLALRYTGPGLVAGILPSPSPYSRNSYAYDVTTNVHTLLSRAVLSAPSVGSGNDLPVGMSRDGLTVFRESTSPVLSTGYAGGGVTATSTSITSGTTDLLLAREGLPSISANDESLCRLTGDGCVSDDGRIAVFSSNATDLVPGVIRFSQGYDAYVRDEANGTTRLINHIGDGVTTTRADTVNAFVCGDGSTVFLAGGGLDGIVSGFVSSLPVLSAFAYDVATATTRLISGRSDQPTMESNGSTFMAGASRDGRFVVAETEATNLVGGINDVNGAMDIVLFDLQTGARTLVSRSLSNAFASSDGKSSDPRISADGRYVVFESRSSDLVTGFIDRNGFGSDVYQFDASTGVVRLVSHRFGSSQESGDGGSLDPWPSNDGAVVYASSSNDLMQGFIDQNGGGWGDYFRETANGTVEIVTVDALQPLAGQNKERVTTVRVSRDGSAMCFSSAATNLVPGFVDNNGSHLVFGRDVYVRDFSQGTTTLLSRRVGTVFETGDQGAFGCAVSHDGRRVLWHGLSDDLVANQLAIGLRNNLFLTFVDSGVTELVTRRLPMTSLSSASDGTGSFALSGDGSRALFVSDSSKLVPNDFNVRSDVFSADLGVHCLGASLCGAAANSTGQGAELCITGSEIAAANLLSLSVRNLPQQSFGMLLVSTDTGVIGNLGGGPGDLCINGPSLGRYNDLIQNSGASGTISVAVNIARIPGNNQLTAATAGSTFGWQYWYRDVLGGAAVNNLSNASSVTFR